MSKIKNTPHYCEECDQYFATMRGHQIHITRMHGAEPAMDTYDPYRLRDTVMQKMFSADRETLLHVLGVLNGDTPLRDENCVEPYLTLKEIGKRLSISPCSLWRWRVPGHRLGGRRRFKMSEVQAYLESDECQTRTQELREHRKRGDS